MRRTSVFLSAAAVVLETTAIEPLRAQGTPGVPRATLVRTSPTIELPSHVDSNSPAYWELTDGQTLLHVLTSVAGEPTLNRGANLRRLDALGTVTYLGDMNGGGWLESVIPAPDGRLYGYYHNEPTGVCNGSDKTAPRIGAARSDDGGRTWVDQGIILEAEPHSFECNSANTFFVGGYGDFSAVLDEDSLDVYFVFSAYGRPREEQGVVVGRMQWAHRDEPVGNLAVWKDGVWLYPRQDEDGRYVHPAPTPAFAPSASWHRDGARLDALWGPSVHWNTHLEQYVILLNSAADARWSQEGVYVVFAPSLADPPTWSTPQRLLKGGAWYPQVIGLESSLGTDKRAGERARFFLGGASEYFIVFSRPQTP